MQMEQTIATCDQPHDFTNTQVGRKINPRRRRKSCSMDESARWSPSWFLPESSRTRPRMATVDEGFDQDQIRPQSRAACNNCNFASSPISRNRNRTNNVMGSQASLRHHHRRNQQSSKHVCQQTGTDSTTPLVVCERAAQRGKNPLQQSAPNHMPQQNKDLKNAHSAPLLLKERILPAW